MSTITVDMETVGMNENEMDVTVTTMATGGADDEDDEELSDDGISSSDSDDFVNSASVDNVVAQLVVAGPVGVAAAAAIASGRKRKRPYSFEMNPSVRKRQQTRILRKLKATMDEYTRRVGQQAVVLLCTPGKPHNCYKVFGAKPLEDVIRSCKTLVMQELEHALAQQAPTIIQEDQTLHELPPLVIDGIPTPVEKMSQAQLRAFIPLMLKYATGRGKPGWGKESTRPPWWPEDLPWANVRSDVRSEDEKHRISWTHSLRQIVLNCYRYHGRDDLLPSFIEADENNQGVGGGGGGGGGGGSDEKEEKPTIQNLVQAEYTQTVLKTIQHPDGTLSIVHLHPNGSLVTLADVQSDMEKMQNTHAEATHAVQTLADVATQDMHNDDESGVRTVATLTEATINIDKDCQIILTGENGQQAYPVSGMVTIPVSMYQTVVANLTQTHQSDGQGEMQVVMTQQQESEQQQQQQQQQQQVLTVSTVQLPAESMVQNSSNS